MRAVLIKRADLKVGPYVITNGGEESRYRLTTSRFVSDPAFVSRR